jgi:osmotically-inducible protein OsmY
MTAKSNDAQAARLDDEIARNIRLALKLDHDVPDEMIGVSVSNGVASLDGNVETYLQKEAAEAGARKVKGVRDVINRIDLQPAI